MYIKPLIFEFDDGLGSKWIGRAVAETGIEGSDVWINGVNPGGVAANGRNLEHALQAFKESCQLVILDTKEDGGTPAKIAAEILRFFWQTNESTAKEWETAVENGVELRRF